MDREEGIVKKYLTLLGHQDVVYEPDGQVPPDFLVNGKIAVEVRRLNQHYFESEAPKPLEQLEHSLRDRLTRLLQKYEIEPHDSSAFVFLNFQRPLQPSKNNLKKIKTELDLHLAELDKPKKVDINDNLSIQFLPTLNRYESAYVYGGMTDNDTGGFLFSKMYKNLAIVIEEKQGKVKPYLNRYSSWWLALVDYLNFGSGLTEKELNQLKKTVPSDVVFQKVLLISPTDPANAFTLLG